MSADESGIKATEGSLIESPTQANPSATIGLLDGRSTYEWKSRYPKEARRAYYIEGGYVLTMLFVSMISIYFTWRGIIADWLAINDAAEIETLKKYSLYLAGGAIGGTVFGMKFLYRAVAKGWWNEDRRLWRVLSPWLSVGVAFAVGALIEAGFLSVKGPSKLSTILGVGFLVGYFTDSALAKMQEIADVLFGKPDTSAKTNARE